MARRPRRSAKTKVTSGAKAAEANAKGHPAVKPSTASAWDRLETGLPSRRDWAPAPKKDFSDE
jgi:hypothetical protein